MATKKGKAGTGRKAAPAKKAAKKKAGHASIPRVGAGHPKKKK